MADGLDIINTIRLRDNEITNQNRDLQYDLDRKAERIARKTGVYPMDWDEFNEAHPATIKEEGKLKHALKWGMGFAAVGAIAGAILMPLNIIVAGGAGLLEIGAGMVVGGMLGTAAGGAGGALFSLFDDQKPEIRADQLEKYQDYLKDFEREHRVSRTREPEQARAEEPESSRWRDHAEQSRDHDLQTAR